MKKICISCGKPLYSNDDFPNGDNSKLFCLYCAGPNGDLKSYDDILSSMAHFLIETQGLDKVAANKNARIIMSRLPAWKDYQSHN